MVEHDLLLSVPLPHYPDIFHNYVIHVKSYEILFFVEATTLNHSQNTWNFIFTYKHGEEKLFLLDPPNLSPYLSGNIEGEISVFLPSPLYDSLDDEDASFCNIEIFYCGFHDILNDSFDCDPNFSTVDISKPLIFDDSFSDELKLPQVVKAFQPRLMVMSGSCGLDINSTSNQKYVESFQAPHHSLIHLEIQSNL